MAPEVFANSDFLVKPLDTWAFGMTIYVYLMNRFPFDDSAFEKIG